MEFNAAVTEITPDTIKYRLENVEKEIANDFVFAMTGCHPNHDFLRSIGVDLDFDSRKTYFEYRYDEDKHPAFIHRRRDRCRQQMQTKFYRKWPLSRWPNAEPSKQSNQKKTSRRIDGGIFFYGVCFATEYRRVTTDLVHPLYMASAQIA